MKIHVPQTDRPVLVCGTMFEVRRPNKIRESKDKIKVKILNGYVQTYNQEYIMPLILHLMVFIMTVCCTAKAQNILIIRQGLLLFGVIWGHAKQRGLE